MYFKLWGKKLVIILNIVTLFTFSVYIDWILFVTNYRKNDSNELRKKVYWLI